MNQLRILLAAFVCSLALSAAAQDTNQLKTAIGVFENRTGVVILKAFSQVGSMAAGPDEIIVRCKESSEPVTGATTCGLLIVVNRDRLPREHIYLDQDELDPLLGAVDYLNKITSDVTKLPVFEAGYTTKSGLRLLARSERKNGGIRYFLEIPRRAPDRDLAGPDEPALRSARAGAEGPEQL